MSQRCRPWPRWRRNPDRERARPIYIPFIVILKRRFKLSIHGHPAWQGVLTLMLRGWRCDARGKKGGLASSGMGIHGHDDRGPSTQGCQPGRIANDAVERITAARAAAADGVCPKAAGRFRDLLRDYTRRLRQQIGYARIRGKPRARRSTGSAANSPARPGAAQTAAGAELRVEGFRGQARGFRINGRA